MGAHLAGHRVVDPAGPGHPEESKSLACEECQSKAPYLDTKDERESADVQREINLMMTLPDHANIAKVVDAMSVRDRGQNVWLVLMHVYRGGELRKRLNKLPLVLDPRAVKQFL